MLMLLNQLPTIENFQQGRSEERGRRGVRGQHPVPIQPEELQDPVHRQ